jgi:serine/threonine-protein kinase
MIAMPLASGSRLGPYDILSPLGAGGMGEVYRAKDTKLGRDVALKILPASFTTDPERVARFRREAQVLASLNHPHIAQIHGMEESNGTQFLVLELVDGESLDKRIARGPIPVDEALGIAKQIAEALEAAHEKGIIHRDLKPANIALTNDGNVKVLDFGLAKAVEATGSMSDLSMSPTITTPAMMTGVGVILGTAAYMSPEQAKGRPADKRSDIWAFGCVLFEMLTGRRAFEGEDVSETLAAVQTRDPDLSILPESTPPTIRRLVARCLRRDSRRRLHDMADARIELEEAFAESAITPLSASDHANRLPWTRVLPLLAASIVAGAIGAWIFKPASPVERASTKLLLDVQPAERLTGSVLSTRPSRTAMAFSPDGRTIVFTGVHGRVSQLFKRRLDDIEAAAIPGTEGAIGPFFSPNGQWVGFSADHKLKKVPIGGGPPVAICDVPADSGVWGASWGSDDSIFFATRFEGIARVSAGGGKPGSVTHPDRSKSESPHILPFVLPGGKAMLYTVMGSSFNWEQTSIVAQLLSTGEQRTLLQGGADARYVSSGHLVYLKAGTLMSVPFDAQKLELTGSPVAVLDNVMQAIGAPNAFDDTGAGQFDVAGNGSLVYLPGGLYPLRKLDLVWVDRVGAVTPLPLSSGSYVAPRVSPNGELIGFFSRRGPSSRESDIWVYNTGRQNATRLTVQDNNDWFVWSPDSKRLVFHVGNELGRVSADGGSLERLMVSGAGFPASWSNSGNVLALLKSSQPRSIWILPMDGKGMPTPFLQTPFDLSYPDFSPDGHWLAYVSPETGSNEVYVRPYLGPGGKTRISINGGDSPVWAHNGREMFFLEGSAEMRRLMVSDVDASNGFHAGKPRPLFEWAYGVSGPFRGYDIAPDDRHFITTRTVANLEAPFTQMHIILNWTEELRSRVPTK